MHGLQTLHAAATRPAAAVNRQAERCEAVAAGSRSRAGPAFGLLPRISVVPPPPPAYTAGAFADRTPRHEALCDGPARVTDSRPRPVPAAAGGTTDVYSRR